MTSVELFLFATASLIFLCVFASKASGKFGFPTLVVFLGVGILAGSEGIGGIYFDNAYFAQSLGVISLAYILFSGGLDTNWKDVKPIWVPGSMLATLGVFITFILVGLFNHYVLGFTLLEGLLIGAIISSTDAGAVFTVLRSRSIHFKGNLKPLLEFESGSNDPMAVFLTTMILAMMQTPETSPWSFLTVLISQMIIGLAIGYGGGKLATLVFNKIKLEFDGLYTVLSLSIVLLIYTVTQVFKGNGFLAVYVAGVYLGNTKFIHKKSLTLFHDGVSWLMQSSLFLTLGLLLFPSKVIEVTSTGFLISAFLIIVARPMSVFIGLAPFGFSVREKLLISWVGLRGSVPIVMATFPLVAGIGNADLIFNLVFFVALSSLIVQGSFIPFMAKFLKLEREPDQISPVQESVIPLNPTTDMKELIIPSHSGIVGASIIDLKLPEDILIVLIDRLGKTIIPRGSTKIEAEDKLFVMANQASLNVLKNILEQDRGEGKLENNS